MAGSLLAPVHTAFAQQMGQSAMAQPGGLVNGAVQRLQGGPGWMYYGINAADRGLGYLGSYMTAGGFIPMAEDDLGGLWSADLRGHLSNYGGFFSNVGAVRKQFIGGTLLGVGVYWDYDGDQNQYSTVPILGTPYSFAGGQSYNQVGVSGEWLTDFGNLRSNGYIPVGTTAQLTGPFVGNVVLCENGINAALGGADLEVGAYVPGLSDWAGMISVGGYAYGNTRYSFPSGAAAVPWFGGVYTRLDLTLVRNWDFSLQYNNDSYFDSTGFARLTYRMGGSRRRNVPDQMEQPMMRNEHIVRAHQAPVTAINPETGTPWRVLHVDNTVTAPGTGTAEAPFATLTQARTAATNPYDIVYVHAGNSATMPYITDPGGYSFQAANQILIGQGSTYLLPTVSCGPEALFATAGSTPYPIITNPIGPAVLADQPGVVVSHIQITGSPIGITDGGGVLAPGVVTVSDVIVAGGAGFPQRGVEISNSTGTFNFDRLQLQNLSDSGFVMAAAGGRATVTNSTFTNIVGNAVNVSGSAANVGISTTSIAGTVGTAVRASGPASLITLTSSTISNTTGNAIVAAGTGATVNTTDVVVTGTTTGSALVASGSGATLFATRGVVTTTGSDSAVVSGTAATISLAATTLRGSSVNGATVSGNRARFFMTGTSAIENAAVDGVRVTGIDNTVLVQDSLIGNSGNNGVTVQPGGGSTSTQVTLLRSQVTQSGAYAVSALGLNGANEVLQIYGSRISAAGIGVTAVGSNLDIGRDPQTVNGTATSILSTGAYGVSTSGNSRVRVADTTISGVGVGIIADNGTAAAGNAGSTVNLTATNNTISSGTTGIRIVASGTTTTFSPPSRVDAYLATNRITLTSGTTGGGITLVTQNTGTGTIRIVGANNATQLGAINFNTTVVEQPTGLVLYVPGTPPPPLLPPQPVPLVPVVPTPP